MTVSATSAFELTVAQIIRRSFQIAGLLEASQEPRDDDALLARDLLNVELDELQAEGILTGTVEFSTKSLSDGTASYTLDADAIDVFVGPDNVCGTILQASGTTERRVAFISRHEYASKVDKTLKSVPTQVYIERLASVKAYFWPAPDASMTFKYQKVRLARDTNPTSSTPDTTRRRQKALIWALAYDLSMAKSKGLDRCRELKGERDRLKFIAKGDDVERGHGQFYVSY